MIRAIAIATETSDVVGTVELACEPSGLQLSFVRASGYAVAFAPTPPASSRRVIVPWRDVKEASDDGEALRIHLDSPRIPHHRLILTHMTRDRAVDHRALAQRRVKGELVVAAGAALVVGVLVPLAAPLGLGSAALLGAFTTFSAVTGALLVGQSVARRAMLGGAQELLERKLFLAELRQFLPHVAVSADEALSPALARTLAPPRHAPAAVATASAPLSSGLRELSPTLIAVGASAVLGLVALFAGARITGGGESQDDARAPLPAAAIEATASAPLVPPPVVSPEIPLETCLCQIPASPAVPTRVPRVTVLSSVVKRRSDPRRPSLTVEVAAVNNTSQSLRDVTGAVTFLGPGRKPEDPLRTLRDRGLFYEGPLVSGAAVKWRVSARGTAYRVSMNDDVPLDDAGMASADAFAKLLSANTRSVRVHGAAMLTRMRDERALPAIEKLREDAGEEESAVLASLARAAAPVYACELELRGGAPSACVMNTSDEPHGPVRAVLVLSRARDKTPPGEDEPRGPIGTIPLSRAITIPAKSGVRVRGDEGTVAAKLPDVVAEIVLETEAR